MPLKQDLGEISAFRRTFKADCIKFYTAVPRLSVLWGLWNQQSTGRGVITGSPACLAFWGLNWPHCPPPGGEVTEKSAQNARAWSLVTLSGIVFKGQHCGKRDWLEVPRNLTSVQGENHNQLWKPIPLAEKKDGPFILCPRQKGVLELYPWV